MRRIEIAAIVVIAIANLSSSMSQAADESSLSTLVVVIGASGDESYSRVFDEELQQWRSIAEACGAKLHIIGAAKNGNEEATDDGPSEKARLHDVLATEMSVALAESPLWLIFIGHGTFDGRAAAFNLRGPDVTASELAAWLKECHRPLMMIDTTAASGPFLTALSSPGRVIVTATKSGQERNYARFGRFFARRVIDPAADLDKDDQTSLFEAFLAAGRDTAEFYKNEGRIMTEHPLLDDNGDGRGVRVDFFTGDKLAKALTGQQAADGDIARSVHLLPHADERRLTAEQTAERDRLEDEIAALRRRKSELSEDDYFDELEKLLVKLARLYQEP